VLKRKLSADFDLVHICDHSNAMYQAQVRNRPVVVTCHDLLAVRGAREEDTDCRASPAGKYLQRWIVSGLRKASAVACASPATLRDAQRILGQKEGRPQLLLVQHGLNFPYRKQAAAVARTHLARFGRLDLERPFALHVGSNARMKNREGALRIFALTRDRWPGQMVFAGQKLTPELRLLGKELGVLGRIVEIEDPSNELLEASTVRPSSSFTHRALKALAGPIIEAQSCACPVICADREPMSEVGGEAALTADVDDEAAFARALLRLTDPSERARWSEKSLRNAERFQATEMIARYLALYRSLGARV
jgi:glycosyltransferase involved in cell wall biosynthesis